MQEEAGHGHGVDGVCADGVCQLVQNWGQGKPYYGEDEGSFKTLSNFREVNFSDQTMSYILFSESMFITTRLFV